VSDRTSGRDLIIEEPVIQEPVIEVVGVDKQFDGVPVLRGVDLAVARGEFVALTGPSGCGKSTLLHLVAALERPTSGSIRVNGHDLRTLRAPNRYRRLEIGLVFQLHNLLPRLTACNNVELAMFGSGRSSKERRERARVLLDELDLTEAADRTPTKLSGGERQRVAIARALANEPTILLADEPTGNLDRESSDRVFDVLDHLRTRVGLTTLMVTHDPAAVERADREFVLAR
jgi:putative ABC transport system ATP-binding protein